MGMDKHLNFSPELNYTSGEIYDHKFCVIARSIRSILLFPGRPLPHSTVVVLQELKGSWFS